jgi:hypothetical protein
MSVNLYNMLVGVACEGGAYTHSSQKLESTSLRIVRFAFTMSLISCSTKKLYESMCLAKRCQYTGQELKAQFLLLHKACNVLVTVVS